MTLLREISMRNIQAIVEPLRIYSFCEYIKHYIYIHLNKLQ